MPTTAGSDTMNAPGSGSPVKKGIKKRGKRFSPLPTLEVAEGLAWHVEVSAKGRVALADRDLPAGTLLLLERPVVKLVRTKHAGDVCHGCFNGLLQPVKKGDSFNPSLPRYCGGCKGSSDHTALDAALAGVRIKLADIAKAHDMEHELLHLILLLDVHRSGAFAAQPKSSGAAAGAGTLADAAAQLPVVQCTMADTDMLPTLWDKKPEAWRKAVTTALRPLHKELVGLEESGAIPGYKAARLEQLQSDAAMVIMHLNSIGAEGSSTDTGIGLFAAAAMLGHSCRANCMAMTQGQTLHVRTICDVPQGTPLTVSHTSPYDPRPVRQQQLLVERGMPCACERCSEPIEHSTDRYLEGVWCFQCGMDVLTAVPAGAASESAEEQWQKQLVEAQVLVAAAPAPSKNSPSNAAKAGKKGKQEALEAPAGEAEAANSKDAGAAANGTEGEAEAKPEAKPEGEAAGEAASEAGGSEANGGGAEGEQAAEEAAEQAPPAAVVRYWRCCGCGHVQPAHNSAGRGPGDVAAQADKMWQQGMMLLQMRLPQLLPQAEAYLLGVHGQMDGRLHPYHARVIDATGALINTALRKGDAVSVFNNAVQLWEAERSVQDRPTLHQLQYLQALIDTAAQKATNANSAVIKRGFEKKVKLARSTAAEIRRVLLGEA